jgi:mannose-6-phosphate isomerase
VNHRFLLPLPQNRVRRNYHGGAGLDRLAGNPSPADGNRPENWVCSLVPATNPGLPPVADEGLSFVELDGMRRLLRDVFAAAPEHYLGAAHVSRRGMDPGFLTKQLDSSMRLHLQAHPTREFARRHLGRPWGKFEAYVILAARPGCEPFIRLGFQHPPTPEEWLRIVLEQDIAAMDACFEPVPVRPGEVWFVPGGLPHAIGGGLTVLEIMEPSDLVVRCEFEREGIVVPPAARFMGCEPADALRIFDFTPWPLTAVREKLRVAPRVLREGRGFTESLLIGPRQIDCFEVREVAVHAPATLSLDERFAIGIACAGTARISAGDGGRMEARAGSAFFAAAAARELSIVPANGPFVLHLCLPGACAPE